MEEMQLLLIRAKSSNLPLSERSAAFGEIVRRFQDMAFGCAYAVLGDFHLAQDAAQEAFIQAWCDLDRLREPLAFAGWFRQIVLTQCNRLTRGKTVVTIPLDDAVAFASHAPDPHALAERRELRDHVLAAIKALPEHERIVTTLFYINGYSQNEIADFLDLKVATVKTRLHSARGRLKKGMIEMVQDDLQQKRPSRDETFVVQVLRTMGRWPTLGELIEYYSRDDICAVIYYQSKRWKIRVNSGEGKYILEPASEKETREKLVQLVRDDAKSKGETERVPGFPDMNLLKDRPKGTAVRYDFMISTHPRNWRAGFEEMGKVFDVLDAHNVYYQIKLSGGRGLDLLIPAESFPETFRGQPVNEQFHAIQDRLISYLPMPGSAEIPMRGLYVAYCTNPYDLIVSLPLRRKELPNFQPWMANIHTVAVDFDWFRVPDDAVERNTAFLHTAFESDQSGVTVPASVFEPHPVKTYTGEPPRDPTEVIASLNSANSQERENAARMALIQNVQLPTEKLVSLLHDTLDAVWFGMELALRDAPKMATADQVHILGHFGKILNRHSRYGYLGDLGEYCQKAIESTIKVERLGHYLTSQNEINWDTATAANLLAKLDWPALENLPSRIEVERSEIPQSGTTSLDEWFAQAWVVCGSALGSKYDPVPIFENAIAQCSRWIDKSIGKGLDLPIQADQSAEAKVTEKIHQLELLYKLRNTQAQQKVQDAPLFQTAEALIQYGHDLKGIVIAMLNCEDANPVYYGAARLATRFWSDEIIDRLVVGLDAGYPKSRSASSAFVDIGSPAIPALIGESKDDTRYIHGGNIDRHIRVAVATVLGQIGDSAAVPALIQALRGRHTAARRRVAWALGEIGDAAALPALVEALKDDDPKVRQQVVIALGKIGTPAAVPALRQALRDEQQYVRFHAERALKGLGTPEAMKAVEAFEKEGGTQIG